MLIITYTTVLFINRLCLNYTVPRYCIHNYCFFNYDLSTRGCTEESQYCTSTRLRVRLCHYCNTMVRLAAVIFALCSSVVFFRPSCASCSQREPCACGGCMPAREAILQPTMLRHLQLFSRVRSSCVICLARAG